MDLVKMLKLEKVALKSKVHNTEMICKGQLEIIGKLREENERLKAENEKLKEYLKNNRPCAYCLKDICNQDESNICDEIRELVTK